MHKAAAGPTKPEAGVIATNPATAPEIAPNTVNLLLIKYSTIIQVRAAAAAAAAIWLTTMAITALVSAANPLPPLKPNQPIHRKHAPVKARTKLWGAIISFP